MPRYEINRIADPTPIAGDLPLVRQKDPAEGRWVGATFDCPLCVPPSRFVHPIDSRGQVRASIYGSGERYVTDVLLACELERHVFILEIGNHKGSISMGLRAPYDGEIVTAWSNGRFSGDALSGGVQFASNFRIGEK